MFRKKKNLLRRKKGGLPTTAPPVLYPPLDIDQTKSSLYLCSLKSSYGPLWSKTLWSKSIIPASPSIAAASLLIIQLNKRSNSCLWVSAVYLLTVVSIWYNALHVFISKTNSWSTIADIILWKFSRFYHRFDSPQVTHSQVKLYLIYVT